MQQGHFLDIQKRLLDKIVAVGPPPKGVQDPDATKRRLLSSLQAVARDAYRARTGKSHPPVARKHDGKDNRQITSYSRGIMAFGVSHVQKTCREILQKYAPPTMPLISVGCGDARLEQDLLKGTDRPFFLVDPDPTGFTGRPSFLPVRFKDIGELPVHPPGVLFIIWPEPSNGVDLYTKPYDRLSLDNIPFEILVTIYTEDGGSGSEAYVEKINHLCRATRWYDVLHDESIPNPFQVSFPDPFQDVTTNRHFIRFLVLIKKQWKERMDVQSYMRRRARLAQLRKTYPKIDEWKNIIHSKIIMMNQRDRQEFRPKAIGQIKAFCKKESLSHDDCKDVLEYVL